LKCLVYPGLDAVFELICDRWLSVPAGKVYDMDEMSELMVSAYVFETQRDSQILP